MIDGDRSEGSQKGELRPSARLSRAQFRDAPLTGHDTLRTTIRTRAVPVKMYKSQDAALKGHMAPEDMPRIEASRSARRQYGTGSIFSRSATPGMASGESGDVRSHASLGRSASPARGKG
jgi:hypothetical protein